MKPVIQDLKPVALENDLDFWLDILQLWRGHLAFLQVRLMGLSQTKRIPLSEAEFAYFSEDIARLGDTVLADYQETLRADLASRKEQSQVLERAEWMEEHELFEDQMRQLKKEYSHLLQRISAVMEPQKELA